MTPSITNSRSLLFFSLLLLLLYLCSPVSSASRARYHHSSPHPWEGQLLILEVKKPASVAGKYIALGSNIYRPLTHLQNSKHEVPVQFFLSEPPDACFQTYWDLHGQEIVDHAVEQNDEEGFDWFDAASSKFHLMNTESHDVHSVEPSPHPANLISSSPPRQPHDTPASVMSVEIPEPQHGDHVKLAQELERELEKHSPFAGLHHDAEAQPLHPDQMHLHSQEHSEHHDGEQHHEVQDHAHMTEHEHQVAEFAHHDGSDVHHEENQHSQPWSEHHVDPLHGQIVVDHFPEHHDEHQGEQHHEEHQGEQHQGEQYHDGHQGEQHHEQSQHEHEQHFEHEQNHDHVTDHVEHEQSQSHREFADQSHHELIHEGQEQFHHEEPGQHHEGHSEHSDAAHHEFIEPELPHQMDHFSPEGHIPDHEQHHEEHFDHEQQHQEHDVQNHEQYHEGAEQQQHPDHLIPVEGHGPVVVDTPHHPEAHHLNHLPIHPVSLHQPQVQDAVHAHTLDSPPAPQNPSEHHPDNHHPHTVIFRQGAFVNRGGCNFTEKIYYVQEIMKADFAVILSGYDHNSNPNDLIIMDAVNEGENLIQIPSIMLHQLDGEHLAWVLEAELQYFIEKDYAEKNPGTPMPPAPEFLTGSMHLYHPVWLDFSYVSLLAVAVAVIYAGAYYSATLERQRYLSTLYNIPEPRIKIHNAAHAFFFYNFHTPVQYLATPHIALYLIVASIILLTLFYWLDQMIFLLLSLFLWGAFVSLVQAFNLILNGSLPPRWNKAIYTFKPVNTPTSSFSYTAEGGSSALQNPNTVDLYTMFSAICSAVLCGFWFFTRLPHQNHHEYNYIFQNTLLCAVLVSLQRSLRVSNIKVSTALLLAMWAYDFFWTYMSPTLFRHSPMIQVATGSENDDEIPMVLKIPKYADELNHVHWHQRHYHHYSPHNHPHIQSHLVSWHMNYAIVGLWDLALPGLFISFLLRFDYYKIKFYLQQNVIADSKREDFIHYRPPAHAGHVGLGQQSCLQMMWAAFIGRIQRMSHGIGNSYFYFSLICYSIGLAVTYLFLIITHSAKPALIFITPGLLVPVYLRAWFSGELRAMWRGIEEEEAEANRQNGFGESESRNETDDIAAMEERRAPGPQYAPVEQHEEGHSLTDTSIDNSYESRPASTLTSRDVDKARALAGVGVRPFSTARIRAALETDDEGELH